MKSFAVWTICSALLLLAAGCGEDVGPLPEDLLGTWKTEQGGYEGHSLQIGRDLISFGNGAGEAATYTVIGCVRDESEAGISYTILYEDPEVAADGSPQLRLPIAYDPGVRALRLRNRPQVTWYQPGVTKLPEHAPRASRGSQGNAD